MHFAVDIIENLLGSQKLTWLLNGEVLATDVREADITFDDMKEYIVECRLVDESPFIRPDPPFVDYPVASVQWVVNKKDEVKEAADPAVRESRVKTRTRRQTGLETIKVRALSVYRYQKSYPQREVRIMEL